MIICKPRARAVNKPASPRLVALAEGTNIPLDKPILLVGRHQECDIQIPSRKISRRHCCLALITDHLVVRDLGSTNGIRINGIKVVEGNLQPEDELMIGNMRYQLKWNGDSEKTLPANSQGVIAGKPPERVKLMTNESFDEPVALSDQANGAVPLDSLDIPDDIPLAPLDPPEK